MVVENGDSASLRRLFTSPRLGFLSVTEILRPIEDVQAVFGRSKTSGTVRKVSAGASEPGISHVRCYGRADSDCPIRTLHLRCFLCPSAKVVQGAAVDASDERGIVNPTRL